MSCSYSLTCFCSNVSLSPYTVVSYTDDHLTILRYYRVYKIPRLCKLFNLKMTCTSYYTDDVRVKVPSFQKVTLFLRYENSTDTLSIYVLVVSTVIKEE